MKAKFTLAATGETQQGSSGARSSAAQDRTPILVLKKLDKRFGATHALKAVDLTFEGGEIHAIVGENGVGKSTLIRLLTGVHVRSSGEVYWEGQPVALATPNEAIAHGMSSGLEPQPKGSNRPPHRVFCSRTKRSLFVIQMATWSSSALRRS